MTWSGRRSGGRSEGQRHSVGRIILWDEHSYAYWVDEEEDIYILEMPTPETTAKLFELDELDKEQKKESSNELD